MTVAQILNEKGRSVVSISPDETLSAAISLLGEKRIGAILVLTKAGDIAGMLSERDIVRELARQGASLLDQPVSAIMTADVITTAPGDSIAHLMSVMTEGRFRHIPVVEKGKLCGMVSIGDVVKMRIAEAEMEADSLKAYIQTG
ncbi:inosine-5-monophosphate dehydrogenase [Iodidimonas gelatinilytica]|uniref:Inosine-5-monophosphate dehydrogenase n=1 Tax=Iodidimonas gelatinilytica TaxID=1236966 RepID=A0A5A7MZ67_9PROT|nr:CBS domain-containing protein [Iodidimonas gelatinilytica]GEQ98766.1 inosine-5-monophosphate dehydrogenase [Iodidimonas gelatinilytica]GER01302.1 inosine-5-monophosphate dehydrogenase [Iodidimonas gelatinilytica]